MLRRRAFLAGAVRLTAALAALPFVSGLVTLTGEAEPEAPAIAGAERGLVFPQGTVFAQGDLWVGDGQFLFRQVGIGFVREVPLGMRRVLVRGADGVVRRWELGSRSLHLPVHP